MYTRNYHLAIILVYNLGLKIFFCARASRTVIISFPTHDPGILHKYIQYCRGIVKTMINFPSSPVNGQTYIVGSTVYQYSTATVRWTVLSTTAITTVTVSSFNCSPTSSTGYISLPAGGASGSSRQALGGGSIYSTSTSIFSGTSYVHVFTSSGVFTVTDTKLIGFLAVGGGGSGGNNVGGGAGAGGLVTGTFIAVAGSVYTVTVGAGGSQNPSPASGPGIAGNPTTIVEVGPALSITALGGGFGGGSSVTGGPGGSGGGGGYGGGSGPATQPGQAQPLGASGTYTNYGGAGGTGCNSQTLSGGGGGAGGAGTPGNSPPFAPGGPGISSNIIGVATTYATGGRGYSSVGGPAPAGTANLGNGGWGYGNGIGYSGSPGVVVFSYAFTEVQGAIRYNTESKVTEAFNTATRTYNKVGAAGYSVDILIVGGGGGAGTGPSSGQGGAGGGAGGYVSTATNLITGTVYAITIGAGGAGGSPAGYIGAPGSNSSFGSNAIGAVVFTALGGGGGGSGGYAGLPGASGGGGGAKGTCSPNNLGGSGQIGQGFPGVTSPGSCNIGGGGGGAGGTGSLIQSGRGRYWLNGTAYAGGGSGMGPPSVTASPYGGGGARSGGAGSANSGGGGGGISNCLSAGNGGSGIVIVRYAGSSQKSGTSGGNSVSAASCFVYHTFTSPGTYTA